jgi:hypothetical protein
LLLWLVAGAVFSRPGPRQPVQHLKHGRYRF